MKKNLSKSEQIRRAIQSAQSKGIKILETEDDPMLAIPNKKGGYTLEKL